MQTKTSANKNNQTNATKNYLSLHSFTLLHRLLLASLHRLHWALFYILRSAHLVDDDDDDNEDDDDDDDEDDDDFKYFHCALLHIPRSTHLVDADDDDDDDEDDEGDEVEYPAELTFIFILLYLCLSSSRQIWKTQQGWWWWWQLQV